MIALGGFVQGAIFADENSPHLRADENNPHLGAGELIRFFVVFLLHKKSLYKKSLHFVFCLTTM